MSYLVLLLFPPLVQQTRKQNFHSPAKSRTSTPARKRYIGSPQGSRRAVRHCLSHTRMAQAPSTLKAQARPQPQQQQCLLCLRSLSPPPPSPPPSSRPPPHCQPPSPPPPLLCPCSRPCR